jgi:CO/xanthine dehydrogenase Mo-binding subunit
MTSCHSAESRCASWPGSGPGAAQRSSPKASVIGRPTGGIGRIRQVTILRRHKNQIAHAGPEYPDFVTFSYIAHFAEVRVEPATGRIRVPRVVSVADCGRVISPVTAASQVRGGVIWGISATLREQSLVDARYGGFLNSNLEAYPITVNADIGDIDVAFIDQPDPVFSPVGVKGVGEVGAIGVAPAIANAIFHATGTRLRRLPIRIEDILASLAEPNGLCPAARRRRETGQGTVAVRAREITGPERDRLWARHKQLHPGWEDYERQAAPRVIPVLVLERAAG